MANIIKFVTSDKISMEIDYEIIKCSYLIKNMVDTLEYSGETIPLAYIDYSTMQFILKWVVHHKDDPPVPENYEDLERNLHDFPEWDKELFKISHYELFKVIQGANYLRIPKLTEYSYKSVALLITGKTENEMRQLFGGHPIL